MMVVLPVTLGTFLAILVLARLRVPLAVAIIAGALVLAFALGLGPADAARACLAGATTSMALGVAVTVALLLTISESMRLGGQLEAIVTLSGALLRRPIATMAVLPALIGLLPMPGGALFSAPMVEAAAGRGALGGDRLAAINYWFRHVWEYFWPLYPGVILAMTLTGTDPASFALIQLPLGAFMATAGVWLLRGMPSALRTVRPPAPAGTIRKLLLATGPLWATLLAWIGAAAVGTAFRPDESGEVGNDLVRFVPIVFALLVGITWSSRHARLGLGGALRIFAGRTTLSLVAVVVAVMVFQGVLARTGAPERIASEMTAAGLPVPLVVVALPLLAGVITGLAFGFVGTSFPIVLPLLAAVPSLGPVRPWAVLAYACGHIGMMASPLHLCYVVSNRYFATGFGPVYRLILPLLVLQTIFAAAYVGALLWLLS